MLLKEDKDKAADSGQPPAYSAQTAPTTSEQPPAYQPPSAYTVGTQTLTSPLVQIQELKAHLCLLRAMKNLRTTVEDGKISEWPDMVRMWTPPQRWAWFVGLAVDRYMIQRSGKITSLLTLCRFQSWVRTMTAYSSLDTWLAQELPPIDVLMVWHAYTLNPMYVRVL